MALEWEPRSARRSLSPRGGSNKQRIGKELSTPLTRDEVDWLALTSGEVIDLGMPARREAVFRHPVVVVTGSGNTRRIGEFHPSRALTSTLRSFGSEVRGTADDTERIGCRLVSPVPAH